MALVWTPEGNIKGPAGDVAGIPDPLVLEEVDATVLVKVGSHLRIVGTSTGGRIETSPDGTTWTAQAEWP